MSNAETSSCTLTATGNGERAKEQVDETPELIKKLTVITDEIFERWDRDQRSGKLLLALTGALPRYRTDVTEIRQALASHAAMLSTLQRIERWFGEFPPTGQCWPNTDGSASDRPMSYAACFGSNGERDFMRGLAREAIALASGAKP